MQQAQQPNLTDWIIAIAAVGSACAAIFRPRIRAFLFKPRLAATISSKPPDCLKAIIRIESGGFQFASAWVPGPYYVEAPAYYIRILVSNAGSEQAVSVEVLADQLLRKQADGSFEQEQSFMPMNLL